MRWTSSESRREAEAVRAKTARSWLSSRLGVALEPGDEIGRHVVAVRLVEHLMARVLVADHGDIPDAGVAVALRDQFHERHRAAQWIGAPGHQQDREAGAN